MLVRYRAALRPELGCKCKYLFSTNKHNTDPIPGFIRTGAGPSQADTTRHLPSATFLILPLMTPQRKHRIEQVLSHRQNDLTLVLENVFDPHNISAVMRSCDAVGVQEIYVLNTKILRHEKWGSRSSSSAAKWLTIHQFENTAECFAALRERYDAILTTHLTADAVSLYQVDFTCRLALVFGNEHAGVTEEIRNLSDGNFVIPQVGMIRSLNISVACAVTLYEAYRQKLAAAHYHQQKLSGQEYRNLSKQWGKYDETSENTDIDYSDGRCR